MIPKLQCPPFWNESIGVEDLKAFCCSFLMSFGLFLCVPVSMLACMCVPVHGHVEAGGQLQMSSPSFLPCPLRCGHSLNPELTCEFQRPSCLCFLRACLPSMLQPHRAFRHGLGGLNSGLHACEAIALPTEHQHNHLL